VTRCGPISAVRSRGFLVDALGFHAACHCAGLMFWPGGPQTPTDRHSAQGARRQSRRSRPHPVLGGSAYPQDNTVRPPHVMASMTIACAPTASSTRWGESPIPRSRWRGSCIPGIFLNTPAPDWCWLTAALRFRWCSGGLPRPMRPIRPVHPIRSKASCGSISTRRLRRQRAAAGDCHGGCR
jgi:hypothetical protein